MEQQKSLTLLKGIFSPNETVEILFSLINEKIRFHNLQILGLKEGKSGDTLIHEKRLQELMDTRNMISDFVAKAGDMNISVDGLIDLKFVAKEVKN